MMAERWRIRQVRETRGLIPARSSPRGAARRGSDPPRRHGFPTTTCQGSVSRSPQWISVCRSGVRSRTAAFSKLECVVDHQRADLRLDQ
jgi:hypothetical protein